MVPATSAVPRCMSPMTMTRPAGPSWGALASMCPLVATWSPVIQISPARSTRVLARTRPLLLTKELARPSADAALKRTTPPSALMLPLLLTTPASPGVTTAEIKPLPLMLTVAARPLASTTAPALTATSP